METGPVLQDYTNREVEPCRMPQKDQKTQHEFGHNMTQHASRECDRHQARRVTFLMEQISMQAATTKSFAVVYEHDPALVVRITLEM